MPLFDRNAPVWRYDIASLASSEKSAFVNCRLQQLFERAQQRGPQPRISEIAVVDEIHLLNAGDDPESPVNKIALEARKFGLALIAASQSTSHFTPDFLENVATKVVLGIDPIAYGDAKRKLLVNADQLNRIQHRRTALIQAGTNAFSEAVLVG